MKYLLVLLIALTHHSYSQKTISFDEADSLSKHSDIHVIVLWDTAHHSFIYQVEEPSKPIDTVFVVMLLCDTSEQNVDDLGKVYWDYGYEVVAIHREVDGVNRLVNGGSIDWYIGHTSPPNSFYTHVEYLNFDKQKISKSIIVWQSKQF